jgi:hypothetical protein
LGCCPPAPTPARLPLCPRVSLRPLLLLFAGRNMLWDVPLPLRGWFEGAGQRDGCCCLVS